MAHLHCSERVTPWRPLFPVLLAALLSLSSGASIKKVWPNKGSTAGGTYLTIHGSGFQFPTEFNPWDSQTVTVGAVRCKIVPHYTTSTQITCVTGPAQLYEASGWLDVTVQIFSGLAEAQYATAKNAFYYDPYNTPNFFWGSNWASAGGKTLTFGGEYLAGAHNADRFEITIGDTKCTTDEETMPLYGRRRRGSVQTVSCNFPEDEAVLPGHYNLSFRLTHVQPTEDIACPNAPCFDSRGGDANGYGSGVVAISWLDHPIGRLRRVWAGVPDFKTGKSYTFLVHPEIQSISLTEGGLYGGQELRIRGSTFTPAPKEIEVTVGDIPCHVLSANSTEIVCRLGNSATDATGATVHSLGGLLVREWDTKATSWYAHRPETVPAEADRDVAPSRQYTTQGRVDYPGQDDAERMRNVRTFHETAGFFVPTLTANYTWYLSGDDTGGLYFGTNSSEATLSKVAWFTSHVSRMYGSFEEFFERQGLQGEHIASHRQVAETMEFVAGQRYAFALRGTFYGGADWLRLGVRIHNLSEATFADGSHIPTSTQSLLKRHYPAMGSQMIRLKMNDTLRRETHSIRIGDDSDPEGDFRLAIAGNGGQRAFKTFGVDVTAEDLKTWVETAQQEVLGETPVKIHSCENIAVTSESDDEEGATYLVVTFLCPLQVGLTLWANFEVLEMFNSNVTATMETPGSLPLAGTWRVGLDGQWTEPIDVRSTAIREAVSTGLRRPADPEFGISQVEVECWQTIEWAPSARDGEGFSIFVNIRYPNTELPPLEIDTSGMTGEDYYFEVVVVQQGEEDGLYLDRVPLDLFEMPMPSDASALPVRVVSSGIVASSADGTSFGFKYQAELSPTLLEVTPATVELGAELALAFDNVQAGNDTAEDVEVEVGGVPCVNVTVVDLAATFPSLDASNDTQAVTCIVGSIHAGTHNVTFRSKAQGVADPSAVFTVDYQVTIDSITPLTGSLVGGTLMTFVGDGLDRLPCAMITIGGEPCAELPSTGIPAEYLSTEGLQCFSPALPSFDNSSDPSSDPTTYDVDVLVLLPTSAATEVRGTFTYDPAKTPYIEDLTPTVTSAALSNTYNLTGHTLVDTEGESAVVMFNNRPCEVRSNSETLITCWLLRASPEPPALKQQRPLIWVPGLGYAATAEAVEMEYRFEVHSIMPAVVSTAGGAMVTITGSGFHPSLPEMSEIMFDLPDGTQLPCNVLSGTSTELSCELAGGVSAPMAYSRRLAARRLQEEIEPDVAISPGGLAHDCFQGGADHSKGHCFAKAVMESGRVRSLHGASHHHTLEPKLKQLVDKKLPGHDLPAEQGLRMGGSSAMMRMLRELSANASDDLSLTEDDLDDELDLDWLDMEERIIGGRLTISMNSVPARCDDDGSLDENDSSVCDFAMHDEVSPKVFDVSPTEGSFVIGTEVFVRLLGVVDVSAPHVFFGDVECPVSEAYYEVADERVDDQASAQASLDADEIVVSVLKVPVCELPASTRPVYVRLDPLGYSHRASPYTRSEFFFTQQLAFSSVEPTSGSYFGGDRVTLTGAGFSTEAAASRVRVGGLPCEIAEVRNNSVIDCYLPSHPEGGDVVREVRLDVLTSVPPSVWKLGAGFYSCLGSEFGENDPGAEPEPEAESEAEPEPETEPEPEAEPEPEPGVVGFTVTGAGNIRMHKAECPAASGVTVDAHTKVPAGASRVGISFKYVEPCLIDCAPLRVAYYDADEPTNEYQWCLLTAAHSGSICDSSEYGVNEDVWYIRKFEVGAFADKFGYSPERLMLRLEVYGLELLQTTYINEVIFEETSRLLNYTYGPLDSAPNISAMVAPSDQSTITISGVRFGSEAGIVSIGDDATVTSNFACEITSWSDTAIECEKPLLPAGGWVLRVWVPGVGWSNTPEDLIWVTTTLTDVEVNGDVVSASDSSSVGELATGLGGEVELTLRGQGLGLMPSNMEIAICGEPCRITEAINTTTAKCVTPIRRSSLMLGTYPKIFPVAHLALHAVRFYTDRGLAEGPLSQEAFTSGIDRNVRLLYNGQWNPRSDCWFGFELALHKQALVTSVEFFPPTIDERRYMTRQTVFEVRNLTEPSDWVKVGGLEDAVISGWTIAPGWNVFPVDPPVLAQAFRVRILPDACQSTSYGGSLMRGARFRGMFLDYQDSSSCDIELRRVSHPLASFTGVQVPVHAVLQHAVDRTPVVELVTPNRGTARGLTLVTVLGTNLDPLGPSGVALDEADAAAAAEVTLNGYPCEVQSANATAITCLTGERGAITPPSTRVWVGGRGLAILDGKDDDIHFKYIDKWSNIYSWLNSEPPIDGDSVIVPEGQAILLDKNSPLLFFVLVSGLLEFDRRDLMFNATYIWIAGGHFMVGTEQSPFMHQATITLFGDRWWTIELPFVGSKMIGITNLGGLHGGCHSEALRLNGEGATPCYVRSVGKLDLHGRPGISWTRLVETAEAGATKLRLEEAVDWPLGVRIIITQTSGGEEEIRLVKALHEDGFVVELDKPLERQHLGEWYYHSSFEGGIDLRAAVGLHQRNIKVQGDESALRPGNSYMFGAHMAVMFGGEMRVENTEYTRTGQSANFGRYSSHWHNLSPGRTVDVADKAYLRNNTYHNTFQRAVVVHGTDYCVVRDNVAHRTKGHSFFTEAGDEHYARFEHNLAVSPQIHPVLLEDDITPAGFWLPGFTGWHFNNLAVNCARGWRVQTLGPIGSAQPKLEFFNNSAHACGFGWHLKPPHAPPQLNVFRDFTAFRCNTGMFYYGTGNIRHENHRFVECNTGHFMNHLSNNLHTDPFYTNLILVGNIDHTATWPRAWLGVRAAKDNEYFFISGMKTISFFNSPAIAGCFKTMCTMRTERCEWYNSTRYTSVPPPLGGILWDLDGTMTGYPNGFVSPKFAFNRVNGTCSEQAEHPDAIVCGDSAGETRVRRLLVDRPEPWQLDKTYMDVKTEYGEDKVPWTMQTLEGWAVPVVSGGNYTLRPDVANDFEQIRIKYSEHPYVRDEHGWMAQNYTKAQPISETLAMVWPFNQWRNHFDCNPARERLDRLPGKGDPWGSMSMRVFQDMCEPYNLTKESDAKCGPWVNETGWDLKKELEQDMSLAEPNGEMASFLDMVAPDFPDFPGTLYYYARECPVGGCPTPPPPVAPKFGERRMWSNPLGWPSGKVPEADEHVEITNGDWVVLDIETPVHWWVTVEGHLEFSREHRAVLHCNAMKVWGSVDMGTPENPIPPTAHAEIVLYGGEDSHTVILTEGLFLGNKVVAVVGNFSAAGTPVSPNAWTKLVDTASPGDTTVTLRGNMSAWPAGYDIAVAATEYPEPPADTQTEVRTILSPPVYDAATDTTVLKVDSPLDFRHFAGDVAGEEGGHWPSTRLAAAVTLLGGRSNVVFRSAGEETYHGGGVVIAGSADGVWVGQGSFTDVDFVGMGKFYYEAPAVKFLYLKKSIGQNRPSQVSRCTFTESQAGAIEVNGARDLELHGNTFHKTYRTALWIAKTTLPRSMSIVGNVAVETLRHPRETELWWSPFAAFFIEVEPLELRGNLAAGSTDSGFVIRPQMGSCQTNTPLLQEYELNEAVGCVTGFFVLKAPTESTCVDCDRCGRVSGTVAWKNAHMGVNTVDQPEKMRIEALFLSDNHIGIAMTFFRRLDPERDFQHRVYYTNLTVFGSTAASNGCDSTACHALGESDKLAEGCNSVAPGYRRVGVMTHIMNDLPKLCELNGKITVCRPPNTPVKPCVFPWESREGTQGARYSEGHFDGVTMGHFVASECSKRSAAFMLHPESVHAPVPQFFKNVRYLGAMSDSARLVLDGSGRSMDDGVQHAFFVDVDGSLIGSGRSGGTVVSRRSPELATGDCLSRSGHFACDRLKLRYLTWSAVNSPEHRVLGPFKAWRASDNRATWSSGPKRGECLPPMKARNWERGWAVKPNEQYNLTLFASPPKHHRLRFLHDDPSEAVRMDIFLSQPFRLEVYVDGVLVDDALDKSQDPDGARYPNLDDEHGAYAFDPHQRRFYLTLRGQEGAREGRKDVFLRLLQVVQLSLELSIPVTEFDGPSLINNVATLLQIPAHRIKIVSVQSRAQVANQQGRRLQDGTGLVVQIVEDAPPVSDDMLNGNDPEEVVIGIEENETEDNTTTTEANGTNGSNNSADSGGLDINEDFSIESNSELLNIASMVTAAATSGALSDAIGSEVIVQVEVSNPEVLIAEDPEFEEYNWSDTSTTSGAPMEVPVPEGDYIQLRFADLNYDLVDHEAFKAELLDQLDLSIEARSFITVNLYRGSIIAQLLAAPSILNEVRLQDLTTITVMGSSPEVTVLDPALSTSTTTAAPSASTSAGGTAAPGGGGEEQPGTEAPGGGEEPSSSAAPGAATTTTVAAQVQNEDEEEPQKEEDSGQIMAIVIGAVLGGLLGPLTMAAGYYVVRKRAIDRTSTLVGAKY